MNANLCVHLRLFLYTAGECPSRILSQDADALNNFAMYIELRGSMSRWWGGNHNLVHKHVTAQSTTSHSA